MRLNTQLLQSVITYDGTQLSPQYILRKAGIMGDGLIAFIGPAQVKITEMVDVEDELGNSPIYSPLMLHFIGEFFHMHLPQGVFLQRLFIATLKDLIADIAKQTSQADWLDTLKRDGDDIMIGSHKLSVSIVTKSPVSCLMHVGLNIDDTGTPVSTSSLNKLGIDYKELAGEALRCFTKEYQDIHLASCKVRPVI